jgi:transketolase
MEAADILENQGIHARVLSMPCWELFDDQAENYKNFLFPTGIPRLAIEAGVTFAWNRYLGSGRGKVIGVDHYGASAPYKTIFKKYGLTAERIVDEVKKLIA